MVYLHQNKVSVLTHDFLHTTKIQLRRVEKHLEELKHCYDGNATFESC